MILQVARIEVAPNRSKLSWLKEDLLYFIEDPYSETNLPAKPIEFPEILNTGQLIGLLYTIEGSTLGGQMISKNLSQIHNLTATQGARYFNGYGNNTVIFWDEFCKFVESIQHHDEQCQLAAAFTIITFKLFDRVLTDYYRTHIFMEGCL